jgi:hypothetical protein
VKFQETLENMARDMVGDGKFPNVYFVTLKGDVVTVTTDKDVAFEHWRKLADPVLHQCALEDRLFGCLASVQPESDEPGAKLVVIDDSDLKP